MKCKELGKILSVLDIECTKNNRADLIKQTYLLKYDDYNFKSTQERLKKEGLGIPNFYKEFKMEWSSKQYSLGTITSKLNYILWKFLLSSKKSKADLKILDEVISMASKTMNVSLRSDKLESEIENSKSALSYLKEKGFNTYLEFEKHFNLQYGINIDEYEKAKRNSFKINLKSSTEISPTEYEGLKNIKGSIYRLDTAQKIIIDSIVRHRETVFDSDGIVNENVLAQEIKNRVDIPVYAQNYGYPLLNLLKSNRISFEFSALDKKEELIQQITEILELEEQFTTTKIEKDVSSPHKRKLYSSIKWQLLKQFLPEEENLYKIRTIDMMEKSIVLTGWEVSSS